MNQDEGCPIGRYASRTIAGSDQDLIGIEDHRRAERGEPGSQGKWQHCFGNLRMPMAMNCEQFRSFIPRKIEDNKSLRQRSCGGNNGKGDEAATECKAARVVCDGAQPYSLYLS